MSKGNITEQHYLDFVYLGAAMPSYGANIILNLHTADPGEDGTSSSNVATYTGYAAVSVARDGSGWSRTNSTTGNVALVQFNASSGVSDDQTVTHLSMSGANGFFVSGALQSPLRVTYLVQPQFAINMITHTED